MILAVLSSSLVIFLLFTSPTTSTLFSVDQVSKSVICIFTSLDDYEFHFLPPSRGLSHVLSFR